MSLIERARELKRRKTTEDLSTLRWLLDRVHTYSTRILDEKGTRMGLQVSFSSRINDPAHEPVIEVKISRQIGINAVHIEVEGIDERLTVEYTGEVRNSQRQFKANLTSPSSRFYIRDASIEDAREYSEVIDRLRLQLALSKPQALNRPRFSQAT